VNVIVAAFIALEKVIVGVAVTATLPASMPGVRPTTVGAMVELPVNSTST